MRLALGLLLLALVAPAAAHAADVPTAKTLYADGPEGRFLMEGDWLFRLDAADRGVRGRYYRQRSTSGWTHRAGAARLERRRPLDRVDERLRRLVPQGLRAAERERRARLGGALRVGQLPLDRLAQRPPRRPQRRRLPAVQRPARRRQAPRHQPARDPRRLAPHPDRLPARPHQPPHPPAHRRLVELRRHPARGLPAAGRHGGVRVGDREPAARLPRVRRDGGHGDAAAQRRAPRPPRHGHRHVRRAPRAPRLRPHRRGRHRGVPRLGRRSPTRACGRRATPTCTRRRSRSASAAGSPAAGR